VVKIEAQDEGGPLSGTGFFVDSDGTIFTNYSVGGDSRDIFISYGGVRYPASRVAADVRSGLAILKLGPPNLLSGDEAAADPHSNVPQKTPFLPLGKAADLGVAALVMTIGYPLNLPVTPSIGCVGGFDISDGGRFFAVSHIRANVPAERGEGGAPLLNMDGEVVGILESSADGGAGCFVLPIEAAEKVQSDFVRYGGVRPGWLGVRFDQSQASASQIEVKDFLEGSPAKKAGLQPGDLILQVGDRKITSFSDALNAAFYLTAGEAVGLTVSRGGQPIELQVTPEANPQAAPQPGAPGPSFTLVSGSNQPAAGARNFTFSFVSGTSVYIEMLAR